VARRKLTDRTLKSLKPAAAGKRYDVMDVEAPGLGVRVTDKGHVSFIFAGRFPGSKHYTRREIDYVVTLIDAREAARQWRTMIRAGVDPVLVRERERAEALRSQAVTFSSVAEIWFKEKLSTERKGKDVEREVRNHFITAWGKRPIAEITDLDVLAIIRLKKQSAPAAARTFWPICGASLTGRSTSAATISRRHPAIVSSQRRSSARKRRASAFCRMMSCSPCGVLPSASLTPSAPCIKF